MENFNESNENKEQKDFEENQQNSNQLEQNNNSNISQDRNNENNSDFNSFNQDKFRNMMPNYSSGYSIWDFRVGFGRRFAAGLIDAIFVAIIMSILMFATGSISELATMGLAALKDPEFMESFTRNTSLLTIVVTFVYYITEILLAGSPGKYLLGIIIADENMNYASYSQLFIRFAIKHLEVFFIVIYYLTDKMLFHSLSSAISWLIIIAFFFVFRASKQSLYDSMARTAVYFKKEVDENSQKFEN